MARATVNAAAPSLESVGEAGGAQEKTAEQLPQEAADAQVKAGKAKAEQPVEDKPAAKEAEDAAEDGVAAQEAEVVAEGAVEPKDWALPVIAEFPGSLLITNATPGIFHVVGTEVEIAAGKVREVVFETEQAFKRFIRHAAQIAELRGWKDGEGIQAGVPNGED